MSLEKFFKIILFTLISNNFFAQTPKGKLFIIGGGNRSDKLINQMLEVSPLQKKDYIVVLPMSSEEPDSAYIYFKKQVEKFTPNPIVMLNFDKNTNTNQKWLDSLSRAKLIFISGGDQNRFMKVVRNTEIAQIIKQAYQSGSTIAGTSAGAAVMSEVMITGNQIQNSKYEETFDNILFDNIETAPGLSLINTAIIDQHFLKRSRYNRLLSALITFPKLIGIGIDESTAIIISGDTARVVGESEVIVVKKPKGIKKHKNNLVSVEKLQMSIYVEGQSFKIQ